MKKVLKFFFLSLRAKLFSVMPSPSTFLKPHTTSVKDAPPAIDGKGGREPKVYPQNNKLKIKLNCERVNEHKVMGEKKIVI
jgi:hypothetical protein